ncbi:MAG: hypothetical protein LUI05_09395 [Oscillospiraceae bacterium]|nr:hypothetical protein [Oscillospiraceae bacterium]
MANRFNDMCDVSWWDRLKTVEEKDEYCRKQFGMTYAEWEESLNVNFHYDQKTKTWVIDE